MKNNEKIVDFKEESKKRKQTLKDRLLECKAWVGRTKDKVSVWVGQNKELVVVLAPVLIGSTVELVKICAKRSNIKEEERLKENFIYDRSNGHYYEIKSVRSSNKRNRNFIEIDRRRSEGEKLFDILDSMNLLK